MEEAEALRRFDDLSHKPFDGRRKRRPEQHPMNAQQLAKVMEEGWHAAQPEIVRETVAGQETDMVRNRLWFGDREALQKMEDQPPKLEHVDAVLVPTGKGSIQTGSGEGLRPREFVPRTDFLVELLSREGIPFRLRQGILDEGMFRNEEYVTFVLDKGDLVPQDTWVLVCNESGNTTFVVYNPVSFPDDKPPDQLEKDQLHAYSKTTGTVNPVLHKVPKQAWQDDILNAILYRPAINTAQAEALVAALPEFADEATSVSLLTEQGESPISPFVAPETASPPPPPRSPERKTDELIANGWKTVSEQSALYGPSTTWFRAHLDDFAGDDPAHKLPGIYQGKHAHFYSPKAVAHVLVELGAATEFSAPPDKWLAVADVLAPHGVSISDVGTDVRELRAANPGDFAERKLGNSPPQWFGSLEAIALLEERVRLRLQVRQDRTEHPDQPLWMIKNDIMREAEMRSDAVSLLQLQTFVDWLPSAQQLVLRLGDQLYYHRSLVELARPFLGTGMRRQELEYYFRKVGLRREGEVKNSEELQRYFAPFLQYWETVKNWLYVGDLARSVGVTPATISRKLPDFRNEYSQWSSQGAKPVDTTFERISPDAVPLLRKLMGPQAGRKEPALSRFFGFTKENIAQATAAEPGWVNIPTLAATLGYRNPQSHTFAALLNKEKAMALTNKWVRVGITDTSEPEVIVAPEFINRLKEIKRSSVPDKWVATYKVKLAHNITDEETNARLVRFRAKFEGVEPPLFGRFPGTRGEEMWYYDPYVLEWTGSKEADTRPRALPEWRTVEDAATFTGVPISVLREVTKQARATGSEELKNFYPEGSVSPREHLSPTLIQRTKESYRPYRKPKPNTR